MRSGNALLSPSSKYGVKPPSWELDNTTPAKGNREGGEKPEEKRGPFHDAVASIFAGVRKRVAVGSARFTDQRLKEIDQQHEIAGEQQKLGSTRYQQPRPGRSGDIANLTAGLSKACP